LCSSQSKRSSSFSSSALRARHENAHSSDRRRSPTTRSVSDPLAETKMIGTSLFWRIARHRSIPLVFCVGGWMDGTVCSGHVEAYDVLTNTWHQCAPLLLPRKLHGAAAVGHELIVFGGNGDDVTLWHTAAVESYDLTTNVWTKKKDLPAAGPCSAVAVGDVVYVLLQGKRVYRYDHRADEYVPLAPLPLKEWFTFDVCAHGHKIYVTGGASEGVWSKAFWSYDCVTDAWTQLPDMLQQRRRCASALVTADP
jgi:hypothetical protein